MAIDGQVQFQLVLARPVLTPKRANLYQLLAPHPMGMVVLPHAHLPRPKAGYLSRNPIHLALHHALSFRLLPVVALRDSNQSSIAHIPQVKPLPTRTRSLPPPMGPPTRVPRAKLRH